MGQKNRQHYVPKFYLRIFLKLTNQLAHLIS
ncbi:hypothetical protein J2Y79_002188 [Bacillus velezensis]|nr:hypothetical protein [Bacillus velezensis]